MINLAGAKNADEIIEQELTKAGIQIETVPLVRNEVPYTKIGKIGSWTLRRAWYYWSATTEEEGLPMDMAIKMHEKKFPNEMFDECDIANYGAVVRVAGHCGAPHPTEWAMPTTKKIYELGLESTSYGDLAKMLNEGKVKADRFVDCYHIDMQEGLNEFARVVKQYNKRFQKDFYRIEKI